MFSNQLYTLMLHQVKEINGYERAHKIKSYIILVESHPTQGEEPMRGKMTENNSWY